MDPRYDEGQALLTLIRNQAFAVVAKGQVPERVMLCRIDLMKVWIALGETEFGFKPDSAVKVSTRDWYVWLTFEVLEELPEGVVVVS